MAPRQATRVVLLAAAVGGCTAFVPPSSSIAAAGVAVQQQHQGGNSGADFRAGRASRAAVAAPARVSTRRSRGVSSLRLAEVDVAGVAETIDEVSTLDPNVLFAQVAGCGSLLSAGYKITFDKKAEEGEGEEEDSDREVDIYRDTAVRYLGYANEVGEAFRPLVPPIVVPLSYAVAITYVCADAVSKGVKCKDISKGNFDSPSGSSVCALPAAFDVLTFQMLASVIFPGFTINRWVAFVSYIQDTYHLQDTLGSAVTNWLPTAAGLALIPFIVAPLDNLVETMLDKTLRPILFDKFPNCELCEIIGEEF